MLVESKVNIKSIVLFVAIFIFSCGVFSQSSRTRGQKKINLLKYRVQIPNSKLKQKKVKPRNLKLVKPPSSRKFYGQGTIEAEYERLVTQEIAQLYKLSNQYKRSKNRGEIWIRLAERYVEKARIIEFKIQEDYDKKIALYQQKKISSPPKLSLTPAKKYHLKANQLYEWFIRDFPRHKSVDQALYFLGYNNFELRNYSKGRQYYKLLVSKYPKSEYVGESYFALGDHYFENDQWKPALANFNQVVKRKHPRLYSFALYKVAWSLFRLGKVSTSLKALEQVVATGRSSNQQRVEKGTRSVNKIRLAAEALRDYVPFYSETRKYKNSYNDFLKVSKNPSLARKMTSQLADIYADSGYYAGTKYLYSRMISKAPNSPEAAEYRYKIISLATASGNQKLYKSELVGWLKEFGPKSSWAQANAANPKILKETYNLQESTLRNQVLSLHQTAQTSKNTAAFSEASGMYGVYLNNFNRSSHFPDMRFFYGELLFDMKKYTSAAKQYLWYVNNVPSGKYAVKAQTNSILALEQSIPNDKQLEARRNAQKNKLAMLPLDEPSKIFVVAADQFVSKFPNDKTVPEVTRRVGAFYYAHNHFDKALSYFNKLTSKTPWTKESKLAAEMSLDIYKLKGDMVGFRQKSKQFLTVPGVKQSAFGVATVKNMAKSTMIEAGKLSESGKFSESAMSFEKFASEGSKTRESILAYFNAASNYEKAKNYPAAIRNYEKFTAQYSNDKEILNLKKISYNSLAKIYQSIGQLNKSAVNFRKFYETNPKSPAGIGALYNSATLLGVLGDVEKAKTSFLQYNKVSKAPDRNEVFYLIGDLYYQNNNKSKALYYFQKYISMAPQDPYSTVAAYFRNATIHDQAGRKSEALSWYQKTFGVYQAIKKSGKNQGAEFAAEARYKMAEVHLNNMSRIKLGTSEQSIQAGLVQMQTTQKKMLSEMAQVIKVDYGPYIVAALVSEAKSYEIIADTFLNSPVPKEYQEPKAKEEFKKLANGEAENFRKKAGGAYETAFEKALQFEVNSKWSEVARLGLHKYQPQISQYYGEVIYSQPVAKGDVK